jgi:hypothetical protein
VGVHRSRERERERRQFGISMTLCLSFLLSLLLKTSFGARGVDLGKCQRGVLGSRFFMTKKIVVPHALYQSASRELYRQSGKEYEKRGEWKKWRPVN